MPKIFQKSEKKVENIFGAKIHIGFFLSDAEVPTKPCTNGGNYNVTELSLKGQTELCNRNGFNQVSIRCQDDVMIQFLRECSNEVKDSGNNILFMILYRMIFILVVLFVMHPL